MYGGGKKLGGRRPHIKRRWSHVWGRTSRPGGGDHILGGVGQTVAGGQGDFGAGDHTTIGACIRLREGALARGGHQRFGGTIFHVGRGGFNLGGAGHMYGGGKKTWEEEATY